MDEVLCGHGNKAVYAYIFGIKINTFPFNYMKNSRNSENTWVFVEPTVKKIYKNVLSSRLKLLGKLKSQL